jgi:hypothetical protein
MLICKCCHTFLKRSRTRRAGGQYPNIQPKAAQTPQQVRDGEQQKPPNDKPALLAMNTGFPNPTPPPLGARLPS